MDAQHALKGRQKLEEVRRKKAAVIAGNASQAEMEAVLVRMQNLEEKLQTTESERNFLQKQKKETTLQIQSLSDDLTQARAQVSQEEKTVATLRKSLDTITMERDAAFVSREDMVAQLRVVKRRLQEAEEEQYKAEEDAAALRAEINLLQHSEDQSNSLAATTEQLRIAEQEHSAFNNELQELNVRLRQEQQRVAAECQRVASLTTQNQELQTALIATNAKLSELEDMTPALSVTAPLTEASLVDTATSTEGLAPASNFDNEKAKEDKQKTEMKLRELASMVERQEHGRQTLLAEIDKQSLEIERLFVENEGLRGSLKETKIMAARWDAQVQECLEQNSELRAMLNQLRMEQASVAAATIAQSPADVGGGTSPNDVQKSELEVLQAERLMLKGDLAKAMTRSEELAARVVQQSADLNRAVQALTSLSSLYNPVLSSIEHRLLQVRQDILPDGPVLSWLST